MISDKNVWSVIAHVLNIANKGRPKIVFFKDILTALLGYAQVDGIRLCLRDGQLFQVIRTSGQKDENEVFTHTTLEMKQGPLPCQETGNPVSPSESNRRPKDDRLFVVLEKGAIVRNCGFTINEDAYKRCKKCMLRDDAQFDFDSCVMVPITGTENQITAVIHFYQNIQALSEDTLDLIISLGNVVSIALVNWQSSWALNERVKELTCLYRIAHLLDDPGRSLEDIFFDVMKFIPSAWLYANSAYARIIFDGATYALPDYPAGRASLSADIYVQGRRRGAVEVCYDRKKPALDEGPFLYEEKKLLEIIAKELSLIAEGRLYEKEMAELKKQLYHSNRLSMVGQLAASVAHELNEPLTNIMGYAQLAAQSKNLSQQTKTDIDKISAISLQARDIVRKLLLFSKKMPLSLEALDLNVITDESLQSFRQRCQQKGVTLKFEPHNVPALVMADANQIRQIISNLVLNAMHACHPGDSILVRIRGDDPAIKLSVIDTGEGMAGEVTDKMFIPFFSTKKPGQGTGLGLSVVQDIIDSYNGRIEVESEPGRGTKMHISLPAYFSKASRIR